MDVLVNELKGQVQSVEFSVARIWALAYELQDSRAILRMDTGIYVAIL